MRTRCHPKLFRDPAHTHRRELSGFLAISCLIFSSLAWGQSAPPETLPSTVVLLAKVGALGLAAIGMLLGFYLLIGGRNATAYMIMSSVFFLAALAVEAGKYFWPNRILISVSPSTFPVSLPPPSLMNNEVAMELTKGKVSFVCEPSHTVFFDIQNLVDKFHEAQSNLGTAVATNVGKPNSDFGPDADAGR